jgi:Protein of unknown function (DUF1826)
MTAVLAPALGRSAVSTQPSVRIVASVAELTAIFEPDVNVVVLRRARSLELLEESQRAARQGGFRKLLSVHPGASSLQELHGALPELSHLADDVHFWIEVLAELTGSEQIGVRLARVDAAMCPRFHVDRVTVRVVCTYEGRGTEYVSSEHVNRRRLGHAARGTADEDSGLLLAPNCVFAAEPGDIVMLKGEAWPENLGRGAVHRSPPASDASPRVVLTLDAL